MRHSADGHPVPRNVDHTPTAHHALGDPELFLRFVDGHDDAFTALYARYRERLLAYIRSLLGNDDPAADDVFQECFVRLFRERSRCRECTSEPVTNVGGWLFRVARNLALNQIRAARYLTALPPEFNEAVLVTVEEAYAGIFDSGPDDATLMSAVNAVVESLPSGLREVFVLREINGLSYQETAQIAGCSEEAARMRLSRARSAIRRALQSMFVDR